MTDETRTFHSDIDLTLRQHPAFERGQEDGRWIAWAFTVGIPMPPQFDHLKNEEDTLRWAKTRLNHLYAYAEHAATAAWLHGVVDMIPTAAWMQGVVDTLAPIVDDDRMAAIRARINVGVNDDG